jgi:elongation factor Ts
MGEPDLEISITSIKELRQRCGSGVMDCRRALEEAEGNMDRATAILEQQALADAAKRAHRVTGQGTVACYVHSGGRIGAMVEINCETDFVAKTDEFQQLARDIAMQIAAMEPVCLSQEEAPDDVEISDEQCLLLQDFIKDPSKTISELVTEAIAKTGENIKIRRFSRFALGE